MKVLLTIAGTSLTPDHPLDSLPQLRWHDRLVLAVVQHFLVPNLADVERVAECARNGALGNSVED